MLTDSWRIISAIIGNLNCLRSGLAGVLYGLSVIMHMALSCNFPSVQRVVIPHFLPKRAAKPTGTFGTVPQAPNIALLAYV